MNTEKDSLLKAPQDDANEDCLRNTINQLQLRYSSLVAEKKQRIGKMRRQRKDLHGKDKAIGRLKARIRELESENNNNWFNRLLKLIKKLSKANAYNE